MTKTSRTPAFDHNDPIPPDSLEAALNHVRQGKRLLVLTAYRALTIDRRVLAKFERGGHWLLKVEGNGYRLRQGKGSVYLLPGQLRAID